MDLWKFLFLWIFLSQFVSCKVLNTYVLYLCRFTIAISESPCALLFSPVLYKHIYVYLMQAGSLQFYELQAKNIKGSGLGTCMLAYANEPGVIPSRIQCIVWIYIMRLANICYEHHAKFYITLFVILFQESTRETALLSYAFQHRQNIDIRE